MKSIPDHLIEVKSATKVYVDAYNTRRTIIIEAARDGASVLQLAEASSLPPAAVAAILGDEWSDEHLAEAIAAHRPPEGYANEVQQ